MEKRLSTVSPLIKIARPVVATAATAMGLAIFGGGTQSRSASRSASRQRPAATITTTTIVTEALPRHDPLFAYSVPAPKPAASRKTQPTSKETTINETWTYADLKRGHAFSRSSGALLDRLNGGAGLLGKPGVAGHCSMSSNICTNGGAYCTKDADCTANISPTLGGTFTTAGTVNDNATTTPFSGVTYSDSDGLAYKVFITYTAANGTLSGTGLSGSPGSYTVTGGTASAVQSNLRALVFTPTANQVAVGSTVLTTFTLTPNDSTVSGTPDATTKVTATSVNDGPTFVGATTTLTVAQTAAATDIKGLLHVNDADSSQTETWTQSSAPTHGTLNFASATAGSGSTDIPPGGTITYTPTAGYVGSDTFTVQVSDGIATATRVINVTISPPTVTVNALTLNAMTVNTAFVSQSFSASGGYGAYTYSVSAGALPAGLSLNTSTGALTGTPTTAGAYSFTIQATDSSTGTGAPFSGTRTFSGSVGAANVTPVFIGSNTLTVAEDAAATDIKSLLHVSDGDSSQTETWTQSTAPSHGTLSLSGATATSGSADITPGGTITYTPTAGYAGSDSFVIQVSDGSSTATKTINVTVSGLTVTVNALTLNAMSVGTAFVSQSFSASGGHGGYTYSVTAGSLPAGLSLNTSTGALTGTPTTAGAYSFTIQATDSSTGTGAPFSGTRTFSGSVGAANVTPVFIGSNTLTVAEDAAATDIKSLLHVSDGDSGQTETWTQSTAPSHGTLSLSGATATSGSADITPGGTITYTPTAGYAGSDSFVIQVSDGSSTATKTINVTVSGLTVTVNALTLNAMSVGTAFVSQSFSASGGHGGYTYSVTAGSLPAGLSLNTSTGALTGTPTTAGAYSFTIQATDSSTGTGAPFSGTRTFSGSVGAANVTPVFIGSNTLTVAEDAAATDIKSLLHVSDGDSSQTETWTQSTAPSHGTLSLSGATATSGSADITPGGTITYTPTAGYAGSDSFVIQVSDGSSTATKTINVTVSGLTVTVNALTLNAMSVGTAFVSQSFSASGGHGGYTYSVTAGSLPAGLSLNTSTGALTGTPTTAGAYSFTIQATDSSTGTGAPFSGTRTFSGSVGAANVTPVFIGSNTLTVAEDAAATDIKSLLHVSDGDSGQTETWTQSTAPSHGTLSLSGATATSGSADITPGGTITYTPTAGYAGSDSFVIQVSDGSSTATKTINVTVSGLTVTVNALTLNAMSVGTAFVSQSFSASGGHGGYTYSVTAGSLPAGLSLNTSTGALTGTPTTAGAYSFTIQATDSSTGTGAPFSGTRTFSGSVGAAGPVAGAVAMNYQLNAPATLDLAPFITGTAVNVTVPPAHGTVLVSGTRVTYTPTHNYFGADSFSYVAVNGATVSPVAVVTVSFVGTRPDPTQEANVAGMVSNQATTAKRFWRTQIANFQHRLESLHRPIGASSAGDSFAAPDADASVNTRNDQPSLAAGRVSMRAQNAVPAAPTDTSSFRLASQSAVQAGTAGSGALVTQGGDSPQNPLVSSSIALNVASLLDADNSLHSVGESSIWGAGAVTVGTREQPDGSATSDFTTDGISFGKDYQVNDKLALGIGVGYAYDKTTISTDGTSSVANGTSIAAYGSYRTSPNTFIDGVIGYGRLDLDTNRYVSAFGDFAKSNRGGSQLFGSLSASYEYTDMDWLLSPYGRYDFAIDRLDATTETGAGIADLHYSSQQYKTQQVSLGFRGEMHWKTSYGLMMPRVRMEYQHYIEGAGKATVAYADMLGTTFNLVTTTSNTDALMLGVGSGFVMRNGLNMDFGFQWMHSSGSENSKAVFFRVTKPLGK